LLFFSTHLEVIDVNIESAALALGQRVWELRVGFAEEAMLWVLKRLAVFVSLSVDCAC
jgi:hypothetical protein